MSLRPAHREVLVLLGALALCPVAALFAADDPAVPVARALALMDAERALGVFVEPAIHAWAREHGTLMDLAGAFYLLAHVPVAGWALIWTWFLRPDLYAAVRTTFLLVQGMLIACYLALPTAPPRLVPGAGFSDVLAAQGLAGSAHLLQSPYAAVPSGHVAFALVAGVTFARLGDMAWLRVFGWLYPPLVVAVTVATGHHLLADAAAAALVVAVAGGIVLAPPLLARRASGLATAPVR
jgi:hypothetical protein